ncbi:MAG: diaminopimelate decarboxylase [Candidatus Omnitrophica bacterium]|nr:diaminopimelate decarboxylase [Candidatus Omnitrophota bacterium]MBU2258824.1 diaminopimelate decarboxylase [Candidatus Omnitrophota bacterium]
MHEFKYKENKLYCENMEVRDLAEKFGTPLYVYSYKTLTDHFLKLKTAFRQVSPLICYSVKANSNLAILKALVDKGAGLDIVSGGELFRALIAGCPAERIVYASVGKTVKEIEEAIKKGILLFNVESLPELENINRVAKKLNKITKVAIRINPDVEAHTHHFITTGKITNKFGIDLSNATKILSLRRKLLNVNICGLHMHIGSQITKGAPFVQALKKVISFTIALKKDGVKLEFLNMGGGLGIIYDKETPQTAQEFAQKVLPLLKKINLKIIFEPGRFIAGNAGILVTKVLYIKNTPVRKFIIVDAGMNDLIRPALYGAYHNIIPLEGIGEGIGKVEKADVVGPICESGDFLAKERLLPCVEEGDYLAVMSSGAYGFSMSSNYNSRRKATEIMVRKDRARVIRRRDTYQDMVRNEII